MLSVDEFPAIPDMPRAFLLCRKKLPGQTLVELLVAFTVISTGLFAAVTLVFSNLQLSDRDADEVVAINLARDGIEQAKALRDGNWLAGVAFDRGFSDGVDYSAVPLWNGQPQQNAIVFDFIPKTFEDESTRIWQSADPATEGFFAHGLANARPTPWRRLMVFHPICETPQGLIYVDDGMDCGVHPKIGIRVEVRIRWERKSNVFERTVYEDLFDWR